jgi:hypothetical protein
MLFREIIVVYYENSTKSTNKICRKNAELLNVKEGGFFAYHCALSG